MNIQKTQFAASATVAISAALLAFAAHAEISDAVPKIEALSTDTAADPMEIFADTTDKDIVRNINNVLGLYEMMINQKDAIAATEKYLTEDYIQHSPAIPDGGEALGERFDQIARQQDDFRVVVHRVIAYDNYVWMHVNFLNIISDDPDDAGVAGVDIFRMGDDGTPLEHWDALQKVGSPEDAAPWMAPGIPAGNDNGMF